MDVVGAQRGIASLLDHGSGQLHATLGSGVPVGGEQLGTAKGRNDPVLAAVRDGRTAVLDTAGARGGALRQMRAMGFDCITLIPLPGDGVVSPCLAAGRCLSAQCLVGERTASASPKSEWLRRVAGACEKADQFQAAGALLLDAPCPEDAVRVDRLDAIARDAAAALRNAKELVLGDEVQTPPREVVEEEWSLRAFSVVADPILVADSEGNILFANAPARRLLFASAGESEGRRRAVDLNRMLLDAWLTSRLPLREADRTRDVTLADPELGSELLFELLTSTAHNALTRETGTVVVLKDVSDLRRAVEELEGAVRNLNAEGEAARHERDQLDLVLEHIDQPIVVADPRGSGGQGVLAGGIGEVLRMNLAAKRLLQLPPNADEATRDIVRRNDAIVTSVLSQAAIGGNEARAEVSLTDPIGGQVRAYSARAAIARDTLGATAALVCVFADVTELRELERRRLERQLFESEKLAATGRLAASFAHEINNPLEAMKNALYLLSEDLAKDDPQRNYLRIVSEESDRISRIVRLILGFYRPSVARAAVDLNGVVRDVLELMVEQLRKSRVRAVSALDPEMPKLVASVDQLKQVLLNLVLNAIHAMPSGGEVHVVTRRVSGASLPPSERQFVPGEGVLIEIRDTGHGFPPEVEAHLFEPFFTTKPSGTGLGLWVCHEIVQAHGGSIRITNSPSGGALVRVLMPLAPKEVPA